MNEREATRLISQIQKLLEEHKLTHWVADDDGPLGLVDVLTPDEGADISLGLAEIQVICNRIYDEVFTKPRQS